MLIVNLIDTCAGIVCLDLNNIAVIHHMHVCRFQSGFFFRHPLLDEFDYYWRIEPYVDYYCDVDYDVFKFMRNNGKKYGKKKKRMLLLLLLLTCIYV